MATTKESKKYYQTFGPFPLEWDFESGEKTFTKALSSFWKQNGEAGSVELSTAIGVYVWTYRDGKKRLPWNVGKTDRQNFRVRFKQKEKTFLELALAQKAVDIEVYLLVLMTPKGKPRKATKSDRIASNDWLETQLLGEAFVMNRSLRNNSKLALRKSLVVEGFLNDKDAERSSAAASFAKLFQS